MTTNKSKTSSVSDLECKWCNKEFRTERTLTAHMCPKKRRWADRDMTHVRLSFRTFQMFYEMSTATSTPKSMDDFIKSQYYEGFVKFGRSCIRNEYLEPEKFAEWLIRNGKKLTDWAKDATYNEFLLEFVKKEPGIRALERTIEYLAGWAAENDCNWQDYFVVVTGARAVYDLRSGRVSPWILYLSGTGEQLLTKLSDEQVRMVDDVIDAGFWLKVFAKHPSEVQEIKDVCKEAGI